MEASRDAAGSILRATLGFFVGCSLVLGSFGSLTPSSAASSTVPPLNVSLPYRELRAGAVGWTVSTTNPLLSWAPEDSFVARSVYSTLIGRGPGFAPEADLAARWLQVDASTWDFWLVRNAFWADPAKCARDDTGHVLDCDRSHPVTGADVVFSYELYRGNGTAMWADQEYALHLAGATLDPTDPYHVTIAFDGPYAPALEAFSSLFVLPKYVWAAVTGPFDWTNPIPVGSGAFLLSPSAGTSPVVLDRNPLWHGEEVLGRQVFPDRILVVAYTNPGSMAVDVAAGSVDLILDGGPLEWSGYLAGFPWVLRQAVEDGSLGAIILNSMPGDLRSLCPNRPCRFGATNPLLEEQVVRNAIRIAVNRTGVIEAALRGFGVPADTLVPSGSPWHYDFPDYVPPLDLDPLREQPTEELPDDPAFARTYLHNHGWLYACATGALDDGTAVPLCRKASDGSFVDPLTFALSVVATSLQGLTGAQRIAEDAAKAGIRFNVNPISRSSFWNQLFRIDFDVALHTERFGTAGDPAGILRAQSCRELLHGLWNVNGYCDRDGSGRWVYDDLFNASLRESDPLRRRGLTDRLQSMIYEYGGVHLPFDQRDLYAMSVLHWVNWGDWNEDPSLILDHHAPTRLPTQVYPVDQKPPEVSLPPFEGVVGHPVQFAVASADPEGGPLRYRWDFDETSEPGGVGVNSDGIFDNDEQAMGLAPVFTYEALGTYDVILRVFEDGGEWFTTARSSVRVFPPWLGLAKISGIGFAPIDPAVTDRTVVFAASAADGGGLPLTYEWDFGDGFRAPPDGSPIAYHAYASPGIFTVRLGVRDLLGFVAYAFAYVTVVDNGPPSVYPLDVRAVCVNRFETFTGFASDPNRRDVLAYTWDFGDGTAPVQGNPAVHAYTSSVGSPYTVTLTVRDSPGGHSVSTTGRVHIVFDCGGFPTINSLSAVPSTAYAGTVVTYEAVASERAGYGLNWSWDFDADGRADRQYNTPPTAPGQSVMRTETFVFRSAGSYRSRLTLINLPPPGYTAKASTTTVLVTILANAGPEIADLDASPRTAIPGEDVVFSATAVDADADLLTYVWDFGDGSTGTIPDVPAGQTVQIRHAFLVTGDRLAILVVRDSKGAETRSSLLVSVAEPGLLRVTTNPPVPAKVLVDGIARDEWGLTWFKIAPGLHTVEFAGVYGFDAPSSIDVLVGTGQTTETRGEYAAHGFLQVTTNPPLPSTIFVNGIARNDWGMWQSVLPGTYTVSWGPVADWRPPDPVTVDVREGRLMRVRGDFVQDPTAPGPDPSTFGLLRVTTNPPVPAKILVDGVARDEWGLTWLKMSPGTYRISFSDVYGHTTAPPASVVVEPGKVTEVRGDFVVHGQLKVETSPAMPATIFVDGSPRNDWGMWQSMEPGRYRISFGSVPGYLTPAEQTATVVEGELTVVVGAYASAEPSLPIVLPEPISSPVVSMGPGSPVPGRPVTSESSSSGDGGHRSTEAIAATALASRFRPSRRDPGEGRFAATAGAAR